MKMSLRNQVALWFILAMPVVIFLISLTARHVMVGSLYTSLDDSLKDRARLVTAAMSDPTSGSQSYQKMVRRLTEQDFTSLPLVLRVADPSGNIVARMGTIPRALVANLDNDLQSARNTDGAYDTIKIRGNPSLRVYTEPLRNTSTNDLVAMVQTADSLDQVNRAQSRLWLYTIGVGVAGSLLAIIIGVFILRQALKPLDRILLRVRDIETRNLQVGLPEEPRPPELQRLADSLNSMLHRLNETFKAREVFVAGVSHDLRTPLTALQGQIEVLLMQPSLSQETRESLERMSKEARRLVRMTNNLVLNARLGANPSVVFAQVNLRELIEEVVGDVWPLAEGLDLKLKAPQDVKVQGDRDLLKQMVLNLVDNAIKFTPPGGRVELGLTSEGQNAILDVSDTGQGIPEEFITHVMEPFYKAGAPAGRANGGAGLGLAIVKQLVQLHHGDIEIRSKVDTGTQAKVRLPLSSTTTTRGADDREAVPSDRARIR